MPGWWVLASRLVRQAKWGYDTQDEQGSSVLSIHGASMSFEKSKVGALLGALLVCLALREALHIGITGRMIAALLLCAAGLTSRESERC